MNHDPIRSLLEECVAKGEFPSAVWLVAHRESVVSKGAIGFAQLEPEKFAARLDTIYDLASLTKPLITGLLTAILIDRGELRISDKVGGFLPAFNTGVWKGTTIEDLLTHRSGFEAWRPFYLETSGTARSARLEAVIARIAGLAPEYEPRTRVVYSDLNFILLGRILEGIYGLTLDVAAQRELFIPLGLESTFFNPPVSISGSIAASEKGNLFERKTAAEAGFDVAGYPWRKEVICGAVHDGNCHYLAGVSGHAGLFSNLEETLVLARQFLPECSQLLSPGTCSLFRGNLTEGLDQARSVVFQLAASESSSAHGVLSDIAFGHLGFTGTLLWLEPGTGSVFILLTNRTHCAAPPFADLAATRKRFLQTALALEAS